jgi:PAS domain S-box-containing protein
MSSNIFPRPHLTPELHELLVAARQETLDQLLRLLRWFALIALAGSGLTAVLTNGALAPVVLYAGLCGVIFVLAQLRQLPLRWRGGVFVAVVYAVAVISLLTVGIGGASRVFLLGFSVLVTIFFGTRPGLGAAGLSLLTWIALGAAFSMQWLVPPDPPASSVWLDWLSASTSMLLLLVALILPQRQFLETQAFAVATSQQKAELEKAQAELTRQKEELEETSLQLSQANERLRLQSQALAQRAAQWAISAEVAQTAATLRDLPTLLNDTASLISERFGFYHAGIFLLDDSGEWAVLRAANSPGGQRMLARGHRLQVGRQGIVGYVTATGQPRIALNVGEDAVHFRNPDLPETQSEMALPMRGRRGIIGALDVQSAQVNAFSDDDISALQTLADQLAVAVDNARLFEETQRNLEELRALQREARQASPVFESAGPQAFRYDGVDTTPVSTEAKLTGALQVPIRLGDETLGMIELQRTDGGWSEDDVQLTEAIAERMGFALENARLFAETRANAARMAALSESALELTGPQFNFAELGELITRRAIYLLHADGGGLWLPAGAETIELKTALNLGAGNLAGLRLKRGQGLAGQVFATAAMQRGENDTTYRATLGVPLNWQNEVLGVLMLVLTEQDRDFSRDDETTALLFATAAASALQNARLLEITRARLQELETINSVSEVLRAQLDLPVMLDRIGERVLQTFNVQSGYIALYDSATDTIEFPYFMENGQPTSTPPVTLGQGLSSHVIKSRRPLLINENPLQRMQELGAITQGAPALSYLSVPIILGEDVIGILNVQSTTQEGLFGENDVRLLSIIAASVGAAIQNARLFDETRQRLVELEAINQIGGVLSSQADLYTMLRQVGDRVLGIFKVRTGYIGLYDSPNNLIEFPYFLEAGLPTPTPPLPLGRGPTSHIIQTRQPLLINQDVMERMQALGATVRGDPALSYLGVPIVVGEDVTGVICVQSTTREGLFTPNDVRLLSIIAASVGVAIENARLFQQTQNALAETEVLYQASAELNTAQNYQDLLAALRRHTLFRSAHTVLLNYFDSPWTARHMPQWSEVIAHWSSGPSEHVAQRYPLAPWMTQLLKADEVTAIEDIANDPRFDDTSRAVYLIRYSAQSTLFAPLVIGGDWVGYFNAIYTEFTSFPEADLRQLMSLARQAAVLVENFRNIALTERRAEQLAALNRVTQAASSGLELTSTLQAIAREMVQTFQAASAHFALLSPARADLAVAAEYSQRAGLPGAAGTVVAVDGDPAAKKVIETRTALVIPKAQAHPLTAPRHERLRARQVQCLMILPLVVRGEVIGVINVETDEPERVFTEAEEELAETMAAQVSNAIENSRLYEQVQHRAQQLLTAAEVSRVAISLRNTGELITQSVELIRERFNLYYAALFLVDTEKKWAVLVHATGEAGKQLLEQGHKLEVGGHSMIGWAIANRKARIALDVGEERVRFANPLLPLTRSEMALPLVVGENVLGALSVQSTAANAFGEADITVLQTMVDQIAIALSNAQLLSEMGLTVQALDYERFLLQTLLDNVPDKIYFKDKYSRFIRASRANAESFGAPVEQIIGKTDFDFFSEAHARISYEDEQELMRTGQSIINQLERETWPNKPDTWVITSKLVLRDKDGNPIGTFGLSRDVTELKRAQEEAQRRAQQLLTAAEVSRVATSLLSENELIRQTVELIRERFDLYYVALFLVEGQYAVLRYATGEAGRLLLKLGHQLEIGGKSMIGWAVANRKARISEDVAEETVRFVNPLTPETRSEMALPLVVGDAALGAISVQSTHSHAFSESDIAILQTMADQIAASIQNARLYQVVKQQERNATALARITQNVSSLLDERELLRTLAHDLLNTYRADGVVIYRWEPMDAQFEPLVVNVDPRAAAAHAWPAPEELIDAAARGDLQEVVRTLGVRSRVIAEVGEQEVRESLTAPLYFGGEADLVVEMVHTGLKPGLDDDDLDLFRAALTASGSALQIARLYALQRETAERLAEVDRLKTQFLANMSHELRTPLNSIIGFSRVILKGIDGPVNDLQQQDLTSIYNSGQHLLGLINDILDVSRIEAGKMELAFDEVSLPEIFDGVLSTTRGLVKDKNIQLVRNLPADLPTVRADGTRIRQVLLNLLSNAAKFTDKGSITLGARVVTDTGARMVEIGVSDTGQGIALKDQARLFERFSQVDGSATRKVGGTGLGLNITRHLVEMHGGHIWLESEGTPGHGATFRFTVPVFQPAPDSPPAPTERPLVILVVDDDQGLLTLYRRYLEPHGYVLLNVPTAVDVVARAVEVQPIAILLDVLMPNKDGWQVLADLKGHADTRDIPVIMCTITNERERAMQMGAADYLVKPILETDLTRALSRLAHHAKPNGARAAAHSHA